MSESNYLQLAQPPGSAAAPVGADFLLDSTHDEDEEEDDDAEEEEDDDDTGFDEEFGMSMMNDFDQVPEDEQGAPGSEFEQSISALVGGDDQHFSQEHGTSNHDSHPQSELIEEYQGNDAFDNNEHGGSAPPPPQQPLFAPPPPMTIMPPPPVHQVIEILDDETDEPETDTSTPGVPSAHHDNHHDDHERLAKKQRMDDEDPTNRFEELRKLASAKPIDGAHASYVARANNMPSWMKKPGQSVASVVPVGKSIPGFTHHNNNHILAVATANAMEKMYKVMGNSTTKSSAPFDQARYLTLPPGFVLSWRELLPPPSKTPAVAGLGVPPMVSRERKRFQLSLLNLMEFTITGLPVGAFDGPPTPVAGLRTAIKQISRNQGKAVYERSSEGEGRWRIPLAAYQAFVAYLKSDPLCEVHGIPEHQLNIASLGRARLEKGYPSAEKLIWLGVPQGLAKALAPFQRGGVDFVVERDGRALIADEMGLGKTIQGIASMTVYHQEWPLLVLCPSSARYHWENEFVNWLGRDSAINKPKESSEEVVSNSNNRDASAQAQLMIQQEAVDTTSYGTARPCMELMSANQIHVLSSSRDAVIPSKSTRIVICSYGLAPALIANKRLRPRMFRCAIVDESHMLKNKSTKRTSTLLPILSATDRCVLLSGTPALAKPMELWPQLNILGTAKHGWWNDEKEFINTYVRGGATRRAELHAMLIGTVMIRRMKNDILKTMPRKVRQQAIVNVSTRQLKREFHECMIQLRKGKGELGRIAREHTALEMPPDAEPTTAADSASTNEDTSAMIAAEQALVSEYHQRLAMGQDRIEHTLMSSRHQLDPNEVEQFRHQMAAKIEAETRVWYIEQVNYIRSQFAKPSPEEKKEEKKDEKKQETDSKGSVLNKMYSLTGDAKIPLVIDMLKRWLRDPTKGKLCIFAHHISVLDALERGAGLSNQADSRSKYIRIDGSTSPKFRQEQINSFQQDPTVRIALLGITAAGVAVTLTASSTVWFAELFWTPAIMIQAEDRCHRIGQQARVHCLYFVATGTLDDILWKLLENKFRDLGEFVEGKEKLKLVIDTTFNGEKELMSIFENVEDEEGGPSMNDIFDSISDEDGLGEVDLDPELQQEIEELGKAEQMMLTTASELDDEDGEHAAAIIEVVEKPGGTEEAAICLSDDEQDDQDDAEVQKTAAVDSSEIIASLPKAVDLSTNSFSTAGFLVQGRLYNMLFKGPAYGIELSVFNRRPVVVSRSRDRVRLLGEESKPSVGDILVAINSHRVSRIDLLTYVTNPLKALIERGPVELTFAEDPDFTYYFAMYQRHKNEQALALAARVAPSTTDQVIELIDDD